MVHLEPTANKKEDGMYRELKKSLQYIVDNIGHSKLDSLYSELSQAYEKVLTSPSAENDQLIATKTAEIRVAQETIEPVALDSQSLRVFKSLDVKGVLGQQGLERLDKELAAINNNPHAASTAIQSLANEITELGKRANSSLESLKNFWSEEEEVTSDNAELQIIFEDKVSIDSFESLQSQAKFWETLLKMAKACLADGHEDPKIVSVYKSSPACIVLDGNTSLLIFVSLLFNAGLTIYERILKLKKLEADIKNTELDSSIKEKMLAAHQEGVDGAIKTNIDQAAKDVVKQMGAHIANGSQKNVALTNSAAIINDLYVFAGDGGHVSVVRTGETTQEAAEVVMQLDKKHREIEKTRKDLGVIVLPKILISGTTKKSTHSSTNESNKKVKKRIVVNKARKIKLPKPSKSDAPKAPETPKTSE